MPQSLGQTRRPWATRVCPTARAEVQPPWYVSRLSGDPEGATTRSATRAEALVSARGRGERPAEVARPRPRLGGSTRGRGCLPEGPRRADGQLLSTSGRLAGAGRGPKHFALGPRRLKIRDATFFSNSHEHGATLQCRRPTPRRGSTPKFKLSDEAALRGEWRSRGSHAVDEGASGLHGEEGEMR